MKKYDDVAPEGSKRLFDLFEEETRHRRDMEKSSLAYQGRDLLIGKAFALTFVLAVLAVIAFAIWSNAPWVAAVLSAGMLGTIAFGFFRIFGDGANKEKSADNPKKDHQ